MIDQSWVGGISSAGKSLKVKNPLSSFAFESVGLITSFFLSFYFIVFKTLFLPCMLPRKLSWQWLDPVRRGMNMLYSALNFNAICALYKLNCYRVLPYWKCKAWISVLTVSHKKCKVWISVLTISHIMCCAPKGTCKLYAPAVIHSLAQWCQDLYTQFFCVT